MQTVAAKFAAGHCTSKLLLCALSSNRFGTIFSSWEAVVPLCFCKLEAVVAYVLLSCSYCFPLADPFVEKQAVLLLLLPLLLLLLLVVLVLVVLPLFLTCSCKFLE